MATAPKPIQTLSPPQIEQLHALYQTQWWSQGRSLEDVVAMLQHTSVVVGLVDEAERLVGFCRVLTDFVFRATIYDVMVLPTWQGQGLGRRLLDEVIRDPRLQRVSAIFLCCEENMVPFYEKWEFRRFEEGPVWMIRPQRPG